jgi:hypothetical protein
MVDHVAPWPSRPVDGGAGESGERHGVETDIVFLGPPFSSDGLGQLLWHPSTAQRNS